MTPGVPTSDSDRASGLILKFIHYMVARAGLEPATLSLEHSCSIQPRRSVEFIRGRGPDPNSDWASGLSWKFIHYMVARAGLEPATLSLEHSCSIQLSYRANM